MDAKIRRQLNRFDAMDTSYNVVDFLVNLSNAIEYKKSGFSKTAFSQLIFVWVWIVVSS